MAEFKFEFNLTEKKLQDRLTIYSGDVSELLAAMNQVLPKYRISSEERLAGFIDQFEFKSKGFTELSVLAPKNDVMLRQFTTYIKISAADVDEYCATLVGALDSAGWFWNINYLNIVADNRDFKNLTKRINDSEETGPRSENFERIVRVLKDTK